MTLTLRPASLHESGIPAHLRLVISSLPPCSARALCEEAEDRVFSSASALHSRSGIIVRALHQPANLSLSCALSLSIPLAPIAVFCASSYERRPASGLHIVQHSSSIGIRLRHTAEPEGYRTNAQDSLRGGHLSIASLPTFQSPSFSCPLSSSLPIRPLQRAPAFNTHLHENSPACKRVVVGRGTCGPKTSGDVDKACAARQPTIRAIGLSIFVSLRS